MKPGELAQALAWLATEEGKQLLVQTAQMPADRLTRITRLRKQAPAPLAAAAVELLELRQRARTRFAQADLLFFTAEGLEQATGETIARYRAARFPSGVPILDACCGIGSDARMLSVRAPVLAVDRSPAAALCTRLNTALLPDKSASSSSHYPVHALCADVTALPLARLRAHGVGAAFFDPSRRSERADGSRRRLRAGEDYSPPLAWLQVLRAHFPALAVKVSPAIDDPALQFADVHVEFLSDRRECKEAVLWFGPLAESLALPPSYTGEPYFASVLRPGAPPATLAPFPCPPVPLSEPRAWLVEPDPAVIRAHRIPELAALLDAAQLDPQIAYLTADVAVPTPFADAYRILEALPCDLKQIQARIRNLGGRLIAVKKRGVAFDPAEVQKKLAPAGDRPLVLVLTRKAERPFALLCDPRNEDRAEN